MKISTTLEWTSQCKMLLHHRILQTTFIPVSCLRNRPQHPHHPNVFVLSFTNIAHIGACLLLFFIDPAFGSDEQSETNVVHSMSSHSSKAVAITLGVTIPCAFIIGILWCYCMSKVCKTDQTSLSRPKLSRAHTASRELTSPPRTPQPSRYIVEDLPRHFETVVPPHTHYDIEAQHQYDNDSFNDIPIHRYHSDSLEEVSGIPVDAGVRMDSFDSEDDIPPVRKYDSDTSDDLPQVHRPKCKSLDDIRKKHRRKVAVSSSEPRMANKRTGPRYHYDTDSLSSTPRDSDMDDSDVVPERHKAVIRNVRDLP